MSNPSRTTPSPPASVSLERKSWQAGIAPNYIGLFLWVVFNSDFVAFDALLVGIALMVFSLDTSFDD